MQNFFKNGCNMRCLWPSKNQRNWIFDIINWTLRHNQNYPNWNLANIFAWKTTFFYGLRYFIHFWKSFCLKLALNLSDPQTPHITTIFENFLQTILFYVNKSAYHKFGTICDTSIFSTKLDTRHLYLLLVIWKDYIPFEWNFANNLILC